MSEEKPTQEPYTRKRYSQRLGAFCKQLRDIVDGKIEVGSSDIADRSANSEVRSPDSDKQTRLPYVD